jgi:hypothetical protein
MADTRSTLELVFAEWRTGGDVGGLVSEQVRDEIAAVAAAPSPERVIVDADWAAIQLAQECWVLRVEDGRVVELTRYGASPSAAGATPAVALEPYRDWEPRALSDPRTTPRPEIMATLLEIVDAEGPMVATRAYSLYNRAAGGRKLTSIARAPLSSAMYWLAQEGKLSLTRKDEIPWQGDDVARALEASPVRVRELGPRVLEEVPLDEVAELVGRLREARGVSEPRELKRAVLDAYGLVRLTTRADEYLGLAVDLADDAQRAASVPGAGV